MTAHAGHYSGTARQTTIRRPRLIAPLGWHTRYMLRNYARHSFVVVLAFLAIALTIDISPRLERILQAKPDAQGLDAVRHVAWYAALRSVDILTRLFPITCFLSVAWSEIAHTRSRERVVIWNSGRSPVQCLAPVLLFGLFAGAIQVTLECYLRPVTIMAQVAGRLGDIGERLDRGLSRKVSWIAAGDDLVSARIAYGPPPVLHQVTIYRFAPKAGLRQIITADTARPGEALKLWHLQGARSWDLIPSSQPGEADNSSTMTQSPAPPGEAAERDIELGIDAFWLSYMGISPKYLPQRTLLALAEPHSDMYALVSYRVWKHLRYAQTVMPGAMALFGATLSIFFLAYGTRLKALLGIGLAGYGAHLAIKVFVFMGENGQVQPAVSAWLLPALLIGSSLLLMLLMAKRSFGGAREHS